MEIKLSFDPRQLAEKWVSKVVLLGCVLITIGLVYVAYKADALEEEWAEKRSVSLEESY